MKEKEELLMKVPLPPKAEVEVKENEDLRKVKDFYTNKDVEIELLIK